MINENNDFLITAMLDPDVGRVSIATSTDIGKRKDQQDTVIADDEYDYIKNGGVIVTLCDGMGGLEDGANASKLCAITVCEAYHSKTEEDSIPKLFHKAIKLSDEKVCALSSGTSKKNSSGTTMVSVIVEGNDLYWAGVGDSRIYIIRKNEMVCVTTDHNYGMLLKKKVESGEISQHEADTHPKKEALISFIGLGRIEYVSFNDKPFKLCDGDTVIMCSDGLYRTLSNNEIKEIADSFYYDTQATADALVKYALNKGKKNQDNTTVAVIRYYK